MPMTSRFQKHITLGGQIYRPIPLSPPPQPPQDGLLRLAQHGHVAE